MSCSATPTRWAIRAIAAAFAALLIIPAAFAAAVSPQTQNTVETTWKLLDYVAVDYDGAVSGGKIVSVGEFAEMNEFTTAIGRQIHSLPSTPALGDLERRAQNLHDLVTKKARGDLIATAAHALSAAMLAAYPVPIAPESVPDLTRGATLYAQSCAACHGATGNGQGPSAAGLSTPPVAFSDLARARKRSLAGLEQVISQGIDGTAMPSFADLPSADRWSLAFYAGHFAFPAAEVARGEELWKSDAAIRARVPNLKALVTLTPAALASQIGQDKAGAVSAYLRSNPQAVVGSQSSSMAGAIAIVADKLDASLAAYRKGDVDNARQLALSAYLDGFEPVEPLLGARSPGLVGTIETRMGAYRGAIDQRVSIATLTEQADALKALLGDARTALAPQASSSTTAFVAAFTVMVREGLEALLIVVAMLAFLEQAERRAALRYVHGGWISALLAGGATWAVATYAIGISGASRELTEGFGSLLAAIVLLSVGIWMHAKSNTDQWQRYIREKLAGATNRQSGWFLFGLAFVVVYREVFETILFYAALWAQGSGMAMLAGAACAGLVLAVIAWAMLRYSRTLPIGAFFRYSSWLMAILTVILVGKGVAALQEAGWVAIFPLASVPRVALLGVFPTLQSIGAQLLMAAALGLGFALNNARMSRQLSGALSPPDEARNASRRQ